MEEMLPGLSNYQHPRVTEGQKDGNDGRGDLTSPTACQESYRLLDWQAVPIP